MEAAQGESVSPLRGDLGPPGIPWAQRPGVGLEAARWGATSPPSSSQAFFSLALCSPALPDCSLCSGLEDLPAPSRVGPTLASKSQALPGPRQTPGISESVSLTRSPSTGPLAILSSHGCLRGDRVVIPSLRHLPFTQCELPQPFPTPTCPPCVNEGEWPGATQGF